jgi:phosphatidylglycerol lysyltransferase
VRWAVPARWFVSVIVLLSGALMLISSATPTLTQRLRILEQIVPLTVLETSHLANALFGLFLFVVARGLMKGYRNAYRTTLALLLVGALGSVLKGLDYEEAVVLVLTAALLWTQAGLFKLPSRKGGTAIAILVPIVLAVFVFAATGIASFDGRELSGALWLTFDHTAEGARFLRALCVLLLAGLLVGIYLIMRIQ